MDGAVIVSDGAGQFRIAEHALCWVHAERLIHKLDTFCEAHVQAKERIRARIWRLYKDLKAYRQAPAPRRASELERRFDAIFSAETGFATLDRLLARLRAQKDELLMVLKRPDIPLHTNGSENDIRCQVTRRKISAGTRSDEGRDSRDAFLGPYENLRQAGHQLLGLSWRPPRSAGSASRPKPRRTRPQARYSLTARTFAPVTMDGAK